MLCLRDWVQEERRRKKAEEEARKKEERERKKREAEERLSKKGPNFIITKRSDAEKAGVSIAGFVFFLTGSASESVTYVALPSMTSALAKCASWFRGANV